MEKSILIKNIRAVDAKNDRIADVLITGDKITAVGEMLRCGADEVIDGTDLCLCRRFLICTFT